MISKTIKTFGIFILTLFMLQAFAYAETESHQFKIDNFCNIQYNTVYYWGDESTREPIELPLEASIPTVLYNGTETAFDLIFNNNFIYSGCSRNGTIEVSDINSDGLYETITIISPEPFVVTSNSPAQSKLELKNGISEKVINYETVIEGQSILNTLKPHDVLEVISNPFDASAKYSVKLLTNHFNERIHLRASSDSSWAPQNEMQCFYGFIPSHANYNISYGAYGLENMEVGYSGTAYLDSYGKIAAFFWDGYNTFLKNGVILDYQINDNEPDNSYAIATVLTSYGIEEARFENNIIIERPDTELTSFNSCDISEVKDRLIGRLIKYSVPHSGNISVEFAKSTDDEKELSVLNSPNEKYSYDTATKTFKGENNSFTVNDKTTVYYVYKSGLSVNSYGIDPQWSSAASIDSLENRVYDSPMFYNIDKSTNTVKSIVVYDTNAFGGVKFFNSENVERTDTGFYYPKDKILYARINPKYYGKKIMLAGYKDKIMTCFADTPNEKSEIQLNLQTASDIPDAIKAFVWEDLENMSPISMQTILRNKPAEIDYSNELAIITDIYQEIDSDSDRLTYYIKYLQGRDEKYVECPPDVHFTGFRADGEEGLEDNKNLFDFIIGSGVIMQYTYGELTQIHLVFKTDFSDITSKYPTIQIGSSVNKFTKINDNLTFYPGIITNTDERNVYIEEYSDAEPLKNMLNIPQDVHVYMCRETYRGRYFDIMDNNYFNISDIVYHYVIAREYNGIITDLLVFE